MTIEEVRKARTELERLIVREVSAFQVATGVNVMSIELFTEHNSFTNVNIVIKSEVKVEL